MEWVFQYNPSRWDQLDAKAGEPNDWWAMKYHHDLVAVGDRVFFWRSNPGAAITAVGSVSSPVYERESKFGRFAIDVRFEARVEPPLTRDEIRNVPELSGIAIFQGWQGTNFRLRHDQAQLLDRLLAERLRPIGSAPAARSDPYGTLQELSEAITRTNNRVKAELRKTVQGMDPRAFEFLVRRVLIVLGYRDVQVTRYSGDKGIDATAVFDVGGVTPVRVAIQAKRTASVDRPTVQNVRGSLTNRELGLIVSSGSFTPAAIVEAQEPGKVPIGLIDGTKLLEVMVENQIGVEQMTFPALKLVAEALSVENLTIDASSPEA